MKDLLGRREQKEEFILDKKSGLVIVGSFFFRGWQMSLRQII